MNATDRENANACDNITRRPAGKPSGGNDEYSIEDDEDKIDLNKGMNADGYDDADDDETEEIAYDDEEDDEDENDEDDSPRKRSRAPFMMMLGMMFNPVEGWKTIRRSGMTAEHMAGGCFYPMLAIAAASCFIECLYDSSVTLSMAMVEAVKIFVALFFGNFLALMLVTLVMPRDYKKIADTSYGKQYMMYLLSTLALFWTLYQCLPMIGPVLSFLPLWTIYLAIRGARFFRFPSEKSNLLITCLCLALFAAPVAIYQIFDILL